MSNPIPPETPPAQPKESPRFIVRLRGGTALRLKPGRGPEAQFDRLFALLDECEIWQAPHDWDASPTAPGQWISGTKAMASACTSDSTFWAAQNEDPQGWAR